MAKWRKGESGNPKGRPKKGNALSEAIRYVTDPIELAHIALEIAQSNPNDSVRLQALTWLRDSGYQRPTQRIEVGGAGDYERLEESEIDAELEAAEQEIARLQATMRGDVVDAEIVGEGDEKRLTDDAEKGPFSLLRSSTVGYRHGRGRVPLWRLDVTPPPTLSHRVGAGGWG